MQTTFSFADVARSYYTAAQYKAIRETRIGIAGAGGLGSNCAICLARSGFEQFVIADFDIVEPSNLNRQAYFAEHIGRYKVDCLNEILIKINPGCTVATHRILLDPTSAATVFSSCDVLVEAFDKPENKAWLVETFLSQKKLLVSASGLAGYGDSDRIRTQRIREGFYLIGDGITAVGPLVKPFAPCVNVAAGKEADVVLSWTLGRIATETSAA